MAAVYLLLHIFRLQRLNSVIEIAQPEYDAETEQRHDAILQETRKISAYAIQK